MSQTGRMVSFCATLGLTAGLSGSPMQAQDHVVPPEPVRGLAGCYELVVLSEADLLAAEPAASGAGRLPSQIRLRTEPDSAFPLRSFYRVDERPSATASWRPAAAGWAARSSYCMPLYYHCPTTAVVLWRSGGRPGPAIALRTHGRHPGLFSPPAPDLTGHLAHPSRGAGAPEPFVIARFIPCEGADRS